MKPNFENTSKAYEYLKTYNGTNPYIIDLKNKIYAYKVGSLNEFNIEYILYNYDKEPIFYNKTIKIAKWFGVKKQEEWNTEFIPTKLYISYILGETEKFYHAYVMYRKSQTELIQLFIPKSAILAPLFIEDFHDKVVDFQNYNEKSGLTIKKHQENAIKFLLTRKKCVVSLEMGLGKTLCSIVAALEGDYKKILVICPASLKTNWENEIKRFVDEDEITIVNGSTWKENKFTIINYDILRNFYIVPKELKNFKEKNYLDDGTVTWSTVQKEVKTNKTDIVSESMSNSQLYQSKFDLIIIDEAHRLSNKSSGMYEIVSDLIKRSNPNGIFELTGTMIKNNPINLYNILKLIDADVTKDWISYVQNYCDGKQIYANKKERDFFTNKFLQFKNKDSWYDLSFDEKRELDEYLSKNCKKIWITSGASNLDELSERIKHLYYRETNEELTQNIHVEKKIIQYELDTNERIEYENSWQDFLLSHEEKDITKLIQNHKLIEGSVFRQLLANFMVKRTISLAESEIEKGNKVVIFCCFDNELYSLQDYFGDNCVVYNGKMLSVKKDAALNKFKTDENCKVFIGNIIAASVGLNINEANVVIFNNVDFVPANNVQAEYRILRLGQEKDCFIYYQKFNDTYMDRLFEILDVKNEIINEVISDEKNK